MKNLVLLIACFLGFNIHIYPQANYWYFGDYSGLKFNGTGSPTALNNSAMRTGEGSAVITNSNGDLLFYTDGVSVWNSKHNVDISGLKGFSSSTQTALIIPVPETNCKRYFIFTVGAAEDFSIGANIVLVELSGNPLTTGTTVKKIEGPTRMYSSSCTEKLNGVKDGSGGYWVVNHEWQSNKYHSFHVTKNTTDITKLLATDVVTAIGKSQTGTITNSQGQLKFNRAGTTMAVAVAEDKFVEIYDFDLSNGKPSNVRLIQNNDPNFSSFKTIFSGTANLYGLEFSNNDKLLYVAEFFTGGSGSVFQFNLKLSTLDSIRRSYVILATNSHSSRYPYGALQMGPDGKIYIATTARKSLAIIQKPELLGTSCSFVENGFTLLKDCYLGLPTTIVVDLCCTVNKPFLGRDTSFCKGGQITLKDTTASVTSYLWSDFSTNSSLNVKSSGNFWVEINKNGCTSRDTVQVNVNNPPAIKLGKDTTVCDFNNFTLTAKPNGLKYLWNTSEVKQTIKVNSAGLYWVRGDNQGCYGYDTIQISLHNLGKPALGKDTILCKGDTLNLSGKTLNAKSYLWSTGNKSPNQKLTNTGNYILTVSDSICSKSDTIKITSIPYPLVNLGRDTGFCGNFNLLLDASNPGYKKQWSTGDTIQKINGAKHGWYWVTINNQGCKVTDSLFVKKLPGPFVNLGNDTAYCTPINRTFIAGNPGMNYLWSDGSTGTTLTTNKNGIFWLQIKDNTGCIFTDTIHLIDSSFQFSFGNDTNICFGQMVLLKAKDINYKHLWSNGKTTPEIPVNQSGLYKVSISNGTCMVKDSIRINVYPKINLNLGPDAAICEDLNQSINLAGPMGYPAYLWIPGGETTSDINVSKPGNYALKITDSHLCSVTDTIQITKLCPISLWVPTAFSPQSSGPNSKFRSSYDGPPIEKYEIFIFNRWGELLFKSNDIDSYWDGTYLGNPCQLGMYMCIINLTAISGNDRERKTYKGMFYLNR